MNKPSSGLSFGAVCGPVRWLRLAALAGICMPCFGLRAEPPPDPPLVASTPDPFAWTIDVEWSKPRPKHAPDPSQAAAYSRIMDIYPLLVRVMVEKAGKDWHREKFFDNQKQENVWVYKGRAIFQLRHFPLDKVSVVSLNDHASPTKGPFGPDFPDLNWIRPEVFVKTVKYHGQRCDYYEDKEAPPLEDGDELNPTKSKGVRGWIDAKTHLPVAVQDAVMLKKFKYPKNAPASIELSGVFAAAYGDATNPANQSEDSPAVQ